MSFVEPVQRTSSIPAVVAAVAVSALGSAVWAAQSNELSARMCELRAESCEQAQDVNAELNARLLVERRRLEAAHAQALALQSREWEGKIAAVQTEWARNELVWRQDYERRVSGQVDSVLSGGAPQVDAPPAVSELRDFYVDAQGDRTRLDGALSELDGLRAENEGLVDQLWVVRMERDEAIDRLGKLDRAVETERLRRRETLFREFQARALWSVCAGMGRREREECATEVRRATDATQRRFLECVTYSDNVPELLVVEKGYDVPTYWKPVWAEAERTWWVGLCDVKLPEAAGP